MRHVSTRKWEWAAAFLIPACCSVWLSSALAGDCIFCRVTLVAGPDSDGDGLPDACEAWYGTDPNVADTDGDRMSDGDEYRAGTCPTNTRSCLALTDIRVDATNTMIKWTTVGGREYQLQATCALQSSWTNIGVGTILETNEAPEGTEQTVEVLEPTNRVRFYRIRVLEP